MTYENGYDSDGDISPLLDTVEGELEWEEVGEYGDLPSGMFAGSYSGAVESATISKGANRAAA